MSWKTDVVKIIRGLINDLDETDYQDSRIEEVAIIAAYQVYNEVTLTNTYTISLSGETITPDPTDNSDTNFIALLSLKAACLILRWQAKTQANSAISMTDGPSSISLKGVYDSLKAEADHLCDRYEEAKTQYIMGKTLGAAILSPYSPGSDFSSGRDGRGDFE